MKEKMYRSIINIIFVFEFVSLSVSAFAQDLRPIRDDIGFCWNADQMKRLVHYLQKHEKEKFIADNLVAGISPHDDYLYAGQIYFPLYKILRAKEVVIFGVTHRTVRNEIGDPQNIVILDEYKYWTGLKKKVSISPLREFIKSRLDTSHFIVNNKAHELEHSIEALIPFLQHFFRRNGYPNPDIQITPIMITAMPFEKMNEISEKLATIISDYIKENRLEPGKDISFLMSSDANHYGKDFNNIPFGEDEKAHQQGTLQDIRFANTFLSGTITTEKIQSFTNEMKNVVWCGKYSIPFGLLTIQKTMYRLYKKEIHGKIFRYSDTYSEGVIPLRKVGMGTTAPFSLKHWVGFLSAGIYLE